MGGQAGQGSQGGLGEKLKSDFVEPKFHFLPNFGGGHSGPEVLKFRG